jgi:hypothetical protein
MPKVSKLWGSGESKASFWILPNDKEIINMIISKIETITINYFMEIDGQIQIKRLVQKFSSRAPDSSNSLSCQ